MFWARLRVMHFLGMSTDQLATVTRSRMVSSEDETRDLLLGPQEGAIESARKRSAEIERVVLAARRGAEG